MPQTITTEAAYLSDHRRDYMQLAEIGHAVLIDAYPHCSERDQDWRSEILATLCTRAPAITGEVALLLASAQREIAEEIVRQALAALADIDPDLFLPSPSIKEYAALLRLVTPGDLASADAAADRAHQGERRFQAYRLRKKFGVNQPAQEKRS